MKKSILFYLYAFVLLNIEGVEEWQHYSKFDLSYMYK
jgi:hypothetical protein